MVAVVLTALNLRPAVTSVAPLLSEMREEFGVSATWAGLLTTLPALCFAAAGLTAPRLSARIGLGRTVSLSLLIIATGLLIRAAGGSTTVLGASLVACAGIALVNVLIPVVIKGSFPARIGLMTGIYTAALQAGGALGSAVTPGLEGPLGGWRPALAVWAALALIALAVWVPVSRRHGAAWVRRIEHAEHRTTARWKSASARANSSSPERRQSWLRANSARSSPSSSAVWLSAASRAPSTSRARRTCRISRSSLPHSRRSAPDTSLVART
ncbi:hypothetical protein MMUR_39860 [Mycolicibacterium murale]|uniref:Major facilitator superfamily (MFS) profile domain-containing protein n=1 Tax=Mycolicibacterium murale TaxID=182220 RepID=A0A7I9WR61_9MYCO|nr:hypothetical protein MMUR_39860 [Mycolicibacterium murale]